MKQARKDMFLGRLPEDMWTRANDVQRIALHHIELLVQSLEEDELEELYKQLIKWKEVKQLERC